MIHNTSTKIVASLVCLCLLPSCRAQAVAVPKTPDEQLKEIAAILRSKLEVSFPKGYRDEFGSLSVGIAKAPIKLAVQAAFNDSTLALHLVTSDAALGDKTSLLKTSMAPALTCDNDWPCKANCSDRCQLLFDTESYLRSFFSDKEAADLTFNSNVASYSFALTSFAMAVSDDLNSATLKSVATAGPASMSGKVAASPRPGFNNLCVPVANLSLPRTDVTSTDIHSSWSGSIRPRVVTSALNLELHLENRRLPFTLVGDRYFATAYGHPNDEIVHCGLPFDLQLVPVRSSPSERFALYMEAFPEDAMQLASVLFKPLTMDQFTLHLEEADDALWVIAVRSH